MSDDRTHGNTAFVKALDPDGPLSQLKVKASMTENHFCSHIFNSVPGKEYFSLGYPPLTTLFLKHLYMSNKSSIYSPAHL